MPQNYTQLIQYDEKRFYIDGETFETVESARIHCVRLCNNGNGNTPERFNFYAIILEISPKRKDGIKSLEESLKAMLESRKTIFSKQFKSGFHG
jgi:hypothetical protein